MEWIDPNTPIWQLTVGELKELLNSTTSNIILENNTIDADKKYVYGLKGLSDVLGCSKSHAAKLKATGILDSAISQTGRKIIIDREKVIELFNTHKQL